MKKFIAYFSIMALFALCFFIPVGLKGVNAEGDANNPYEISSTAQFNAYAQGVNNGEYVGAYFKLTSSLNFNGGEFTSFGNSENPFSGTFDGGGNTISGVKIEISNVDENEMPYGIFGCTNNAKISNLGVQVEFQVKNCQTKTERVYVGGIVGHAVNDTAIKNCKAETKLSVPEQTESALALNFGGIVGMMEGSRVNDCYVLIDFNYVSSAATTGVVNFGGIVGNMQNGSIYNVYVAPTSETVDSITGVVAEKENMQLSNSGSAEINFGGIVGFADGKNLKLFNTLFIGYLKSSLNVNYAGIIGKISTNNISKPLASNIYSSRYLKINNANTVTFDKAIGNGDEIGVTNSKLEQINAFPNNYSWFEGSFFDQETPWNFSDVWKQTTIFSASGIFLPELQQFSTLTVTLNYKNTKWENVYTLTFEGEGADVTTKNFKIGETVKINANFNVTDTVDYSNYYTFDKWRKINDETFVRNGETLEFVCSNETAGGYYMEPTGKNVTVTVNILTDNGVATENGMVKFQNIEHKNSFTFQAKYNDDTTLLRLEALEPNDSYKFVNFKSGSKYTVANKIINFKLNESADSPLIEVVDGELVSKIDVVYTNNTSKLTLNIQEGGTVKMDDQTFDGEEHLVNGKEYTLKIVAKEGYKLDGIYRNGSKVNEISENTLTFYYNTSEDIYYISIRENTTFEIRFTKLQEGKGVNIWLIIGPIIGALVLGGLIAIIVVVTLKKKNSNNYKRNYKY